MKTIWKFPIALTHEAEIQMPAGAWCLHVDLQNGEPTLWAIVDPNAPREMRRFRLLGTGHPIGEADEPSLVCYLGTLLMQGGALVIHVFEIPEEVRKAEAPSGEPTKSPNLGGEG